MKQFTKHAPDDVDQDLGGLVAVLAELPAHLLQRFRHALRQAGRLRARGELEILPGDVHVGLVIVARVGERDLELGGLGKLLPQALARRLAVSPDAFRVGHILEVNPDAQLERLPRAVVSFEYTHRGFAPSLRRP